MYRYILDIVRFQSVIERLNCLFIVNIAWWDASNHETVGITSETLFQNGGKLTFAVRDMLLNGTLIACECGDAFSQDHQRLVDLNGLSLCLLVELSNEGNFFRACQIHQKHFGLSYRSHLHSSQLSFFEPFIWKLFHLDREDAVRATGGVIHFVRRHYLVLDALII